MISISPSKALVACVADPLPSARLVYLDQSAAQDAGFEMIGELVPARQQLGAAIAFDDQEQPLVARITGLVMACTCGVGDLALPLMSHREALDKAQRAATEAAREHVGLAVRFARACNGLVDRVLGALRLEDAIGKRAVS